MQWLMNRATALGLRVVWRDLGRRNGELTSGGFVVLNPLKNEATQKVTLAHEMGHWAYGHDWRQRHDRERDERQADAYAARLLISPADYALAEHLVGPHAGALAKELEVTRRLIQVWQASMAKGMAKLAASRPYCHGCRNNKTPACLQGF